MINKTDLREKLDLPIFDSTSKTELFQNRTLRPVLKLQNDISLMLFKDYVLGKASDFDTLKKEKKILFIDHSLQKDNALRNTFIGMTIGMLTPEEMEIYLSDTKAFNKRIISMLTERIKSQLEFI
ncbi:glyoxalase [uncultured Chryseobacterium sp.]|uniref:glyoxalase n=1 Tax=uncultured Chryseobacterium sp. TaxID=259322 RepID=UPI0025E5596E|nr:glyoxalase [uncultured Chryseobacterium sp.]